MGYKRRHFLKTATLTAASGILMSNKILSSTQGKKIRILVWDERSDTQKEGYDNFLGNCIANQLKEYPEFAVTSAGLDDPDQGISEASLDQTDVLIWWGHTRQAEITVKKGESIVRRIKSGKLQLIALHSAHWATPFVQAMNAITKRNIFQDKSIKESDVSFIAPSNQFTTPKYDGRITPYTDESKFPNGDRKLKVHLPFCCFPSVRNDGKPSTVKVFSTEHPIMKDVPKNFIIPHTEMYDEPFHVPAPDEVLFEETWATGEWFRSGMIWKLGEGKIFYFRPGHESYPVFKEELVMKILVNAVNWMAS